MFPISTTGQSNNPPMCHVAKHLICRYIQKTYHLLEPVQLVKGLAGTGIRLRDVAGLDALRTDEQPGRFGRHVLLLLHLVPAGEHLGVCVGVGGSARLAFPAGWGGRLRLGCRYRCRCCWLGRRARLRCSAVAGTGRPVSGGALLLSGGRSASRRDATGAAGALLFPLSCSVAAVAILRPCSAAAMLVATLTRRTCSRSSCRLSGGTGTWHRLLLGSVGSASSVVGMIREWIQLCRLLV